MLKCLDHHTCLVSAQYDICCEASEKIFLYSAVRLLAFLFFAIKENQVIK